MRLVCLTAAGDLVLGWRKPVRDWGPVLMLPDLLTRRSHMQQREHSHLSTAKCWGTARVPPDSLKSLPILLWKRAAFRLRGLVGPVNNTPGCRSGRLVFCSAFRVPCQGLDHSLSN